jgi:hypothetical protein
MSKRPQFRFGTVTYLTAASRAIGSDAPAKRVGIDSVLTTCDCGHTWTAQVGAGLLSVLGGILISCPGGKAYANVSNHEFGLWAPLKISRLLAVFK